jgi:FtsH-binding integral membrane protein
VVETIFLDWLLSLGTGLLFGLVGARTLPPGGSRLRSRAFVLGVLTQLILTSVSIALYVLSDDWMWMYWVDPARLPLGIEILAFAMYGVAFLAGFLLAPELERLRKGATWWALGATAVAITGMELFAWDRLTKLGSFGEFASGAAGGLEGTFLVVLAVGLPGVVLVLAAMLRTLARTPAPASS